MRVENDGNVVYVHLINTVNVLSRKQRVLEVGVIGDYDRYGRLMGVEIMDRSFFVRGKGKKKRKGC